MSGKEQDLKGAHDEGATMNRMSWGQELYYNGIEAPKEAALKKSQLRLKSQGARTNKLGVRYNGPPDYRLDPDEMRRRAPNFTSNAVPKPPYEMNEFSCYVCMRPMKTKRHLDNHRGSDKHRGAVGLRRRDERRAYGRDRGRPAIAPRGMAMETRQLREIHISYGENSGSAVIVDPVPGL
jgi:hypothetical protein